MKKALDKALIRQIMKEKRLLHRKKVFSFQDEIIIKKLLEHPVYQKSKMIGCYVSLPYEIQTFNFITIALNTHRVCVPKVVGNDMFFYEICSLNDLKEGAFHILEPTTNIQIPSEEIDLMIVPLLAYDRYKYRVGYGGGFYDRYFAKGFQGYKIGLAYSFQYVDSISVDEYDQQLDEIITENT